MRTLETILIKLITIVGFTSFYHNKSRFRVEGFYYRYIYKDGKTSDPKQCHRLFANCIGGYGICGSYPLLSEVRLKDLRFSINSARWFFFRQHWSGLWYDLIRPNIYHNTFTDWKYSFRTSRYPKRMTQDEYNEYILNRAVDSALKSLRKKRK